MDKKTIISIYCVSVALTAPLAGAAGSGGLEALGDRQSSEAASLNDQFQSRADALARDNLKAYRAYLEGKGPYPIKYREDLKQLSREQAEAVEELAAKHSKESRALREERRALVSRGVRLPSGSSKGMQGGAIGSSSSGSSPYAAPQSPSFGQALDGSKVPKLLEYPGVPARAPKKK